MSANGVTRTLTYWKLAIFKGCNGWFIVTAMALLSATETTDWAGLSAFGRVRIIIYCLVAGGKFLEGFMDQTISRLQSGKPPTSTGDTTPPFKAETKT